MLRAFVEFILLFIPETKLFRLKAALWIAIGKDIDISSRLCSSVKIRCPQLFIGKETFIGMETMITGGNAQIKIGNSCDISSRVLIISGTHTIGTPESDRMAINDHSLDITIGDGVWIGANSTIMPGVSIGDKTVIGAGSLVNKSIPPYCIAVGNPCKVIKKWDFDKKIWLKI
jgi:maltose O-acetyltransferase